MLGPLFEPPGVREPDGALPVDMLPAPEPVGPAPACRLLRHFVRSASLVFARQACSCWLSDCVPVAPAPEPVVPRAAGVDGDVDGGEDICAIATLLTRTAAAAIMIVLYMRYLQG